MNNLWVSLCVVLSVIYLTSSLPIGSNVDMEETIIEISKLEKKYAAKIITGLPLLAKIYQKENETDVEVRCRILKALEATDEKQFNLTKLKHSMKRLVPKTLKCKVEEDTKEDIHSFLIHILRIYRQQYYNM